MSSHRIVKLSLVQMPCDGPAMENLARALWYIVQSANEGARIVVLPELFLGPYFCQRPDDTAAFSQAESIPGPTSDVLSETARLNQVVLIGGSLLEKTADGRFFNTSCVYNPDGKLLGTYRKTHIPEDNLYHEQHYFAPGDSGIRVFDTAYGKIAPLICFDQWYPEAARIAALQGAELLVYPTAIGTIDEAVEPNITGDWEKMWRCVQVGHAAANNVYVAAVNRVGREGAITFWGGSFVAGPDGTVLARGRGNEQTIITECDLSRVQALQQAWRFLPNRRPEMYGKLLER